MSDSEETAIEQARKFLRPLDERARTIGSLIHTLLSRRDEAEAEIAANGFDPATEPYRVTEMVATSDGPVRARMPIYEDDGEAEIDGKACRSYRQDIAKSEAGVAQLAAGADAEVLKRAERMIDDGEFDPQNPKNQQPNGRG